MTTVRVMGLVVCHLICFKFCSPSFFLPGECWSGPNAGETYKRNGKSSNCTDKNAKTCSTSDQDLNECSGQHETNYVYGLDQPSSMYTVTIK